jgi:hypothetical protein
LPLNMSPVLVYLMAIFSPKLKMIN